MDKVERLFAIIDALRRHRLPVTAQTLAEEFAVSVRTIYRDIGTLIGLGAPIDGEAGIGYMLRPGFFLPPLMFTPDELDALSLGARWVERQPDATLAAAAANALAKIGAAAPAELRAQLNDGALWPAFTPRPEAAGPLLGLLRQAMRQEKEVLMGYTDEAGATTERAIWPITLGFYAQKQIVVAWCTLRADFRNFRVDRIVRAHIGENRFGTRRAVLARRWDEIWRQEIDRQEAGQFRDSA